jgi:hypothetical protein
VLVVDALVELLVEPPVPLVVEVALVDVVLVEVEVDPPVPAAPPRFVFGTEFVSSPEHAPKHALDTPIANTPQARQLLRPSRIIILSKASRGARRDTRGTHARSGRRLHAFGSRITRHRGSRGTRGRCGRGRGGSRWWGRRGRNDGRRRRGTRSRYGARARSGTRLSLCIVRRTRREPHDRQKQKQRSAERGQPRRRFRLVGRELVGGLGVSLVLAVVGVVGVCRGVGHGAKGCRSGGASVKQLSRDERPGEKVG